VELLNEGKGELKAVTSEIKQGVESAKAIYTEVTGFWAWLKKLFDGFSDKPRSDVPTVASTTATAATATVEQKQGKAAPKPADEGLSEDDVVESFLTHFTNFIEAQTVILDTIAEERERILNVWNPKQNNKKVAIELIRHERRINDMALELSELMAGAPKKLGSVREQFQEKFNVVQEAQRKARDKQRAKEAKERATISARRNDRIDRSMTIFWTCIIVLYFWMFIGMLWVNLSLML
jgi:Fe2+ transport system protein B